MQLDGRTSLINLLHHVAEAAPKMLEKGYPEYDFTLLAHWLGKKLANEILSSLNAVRLELVPRHAEDTWLINAFWDELVCEVSAKPEAYLKKSQALADLVNQFGERWKPSLSEFHIVYAIEYLAIGQEPITLLGVEFFAPTDKALLERNIPKTEVARWNKREGILSLAAVSVMASSGTTASETGRIQIGDALNLMRASALRGLAGRTADDELLQWRITGQYLVEPISEKNPGWAWGFRRPFSPLVMELGDYIRKGIEGLKLDSIDDLPDGIRDRIIRAIYWIAHSATHETADPKVVDLCTSLEILLLPEGRRVADKSSVIALRYSLLGGDLNPPAVKMLYDYRNEVIHGSPLPVVDSRDIWHLRQVCYTTIQLIIYASTGKPSAWTLQELVNALETEEKIERFIRLAGIGVYEGPSLPPLVKTAKNKIKQIRKHEDR